MTGLQSHEGGGMIGLQSLETELGARPGQPQGGTLPPLDMSDQDNKVRHQDDHYYF